MTQSPKWPSSTSMDHLVERLASSWYEEAGSKGRDLRGCSSIQLPIRTLLCGNKLFRLKNCSLSEQSTDLLVAEVWTGVVPWQLHPPSHPPTLILLCYSPPCLSACLQGYLSSVLRHSPLSYAAKDISTSMDNQVHSVRS